MGNHKAIIWSLQLPLTLLGSFKHHMIIMCSRITLLQPVSVLFSENKLVFVELIYIRLQQKLTFFQQISITRTLDYYVAADFLLMWLPIGSSCLSFASFFQHRFIWFVKSSFDNREVKVDAIPYGTLSLCNQADGDSTPGSSHQCVRDWGPYLPVLESRAWLYVGAYLGKEVDDPKFDLIMKESLNRARWRTQVVAMNFLTTTH